MCLYVFVFECRVVFCYVFGMKDFYGLYLCLFLIFTMFIFTDCTRSCKSNPFNSAPKINRINTCMCVSTQKRTYIGNSTREEESR